jgi:hypothetical protein
MMSAKNYTPKQVANELADMAHGYDSDVNFSEHEQSVLDRAIEILEAIAVLQRRAS